MGSQGNLNRIRQWAVYAVAIMALWLFGGGGNGRPESVGPARGDCFFQQFLGINVFN